MSDKESRTYKLEGRVIDWIDDFAEEVDAEKSEVVNRVIKVYAAKTASDEWSDPKWKDKLDSKFRRVNK